ncbi:MAG TPA: hypothetical protein VJ887_02085 [Actinomycetota bacterium]|nr:hypothetical protein [Actinomycetota bacterium]
MRGGPRAVSGEEHAQRGLHVGLSAEDPRDRIGELRCSGSLEHVALRTRIERSPDIRRAVDHGQHEDQSAREPIDEGLDDGGSTDPFHRQVGDDHIGVAVEHEGDGILRGRRFGHDGDVGLGLQQHPDAGSDHRVVADEEHGRALAH